MPSSIHSVKRRRPLLGTWVEIELASRASEVLLHRLITVGFEAVEEVDRLMSLHKPTSELCRLNKAPSGRWLPLNALTLIVLKAALELYEESGGVFDCRTRAGFQSPPFQIHKRRVRKSGPWTLDLGGIAKGFAVDHAFEAIRRGGARHRIAGSIGAGGDLRVWGKTSIPAALAILSSTSALTKPMMATPGAIATSTLRTGLRPGYAEVKFRPLPKNSAHRANRTATVFADECVWADALTKVVLIGPSEMARRCLALHSARAIVHEASGEVAEVLG